MSKSFEYFYLTNDGPGQSLGRDGCETYFFECYYAVCGEARGLVYLTVGPLPDLFDSFVVGDGSCARCALLEICEWSRGLLWLLLLLVCLERLCLCGW